MKACSFDQKSDAYEHAQKYRIPSPTGFHPDHPSNQHLYSASTLISCLRSVSFHILTLSVHLVLLGPPLSHRANQPWSPASGREAIYSNHRDPARAPQSPRGLIGNQRDGDYEGDEINSTSTSDLWSKPLPSPNRKQLFHEIVLLVGGRGEEGNVRTSCDRVSSARRLNGRLKCGGDESADEVGKSYFSYCALVQNGRVVIFPGFYVPKETFIGAYLYPFSPSRSRYYNQRYIYICCTDYNLENPKTLEVYI